MQRLGQLRQYAKHAITASVGITGTVAGYYIHKHQTPRVDLSELTQRYVDKHNASYEGDFELIADERIKDNYLSKDARDLYIQKFFASENHWVCVGNDLYYLQNTTTDVIRAGNDVYYQNSGGKVVSRDYHRERHYHISRILKHFGLYDIVQYAKTHEMTAQDAIKACDKKTQQHQQYIRELFNDNNSSSKQQQTGDAQKYVRLTTTDGFSPDDDHRNMASVSTFVTLTALTYHMLALLFLYRK